MTKEQRVVWILFALVVCAGVVLAFLTGCSSEASRRVARSFTLTYSHYTGDYENDRMGRVMGEDGDAIGFSLNVGAALEPEPVHVTIDNAAPTPVEIRAQGTAQGGAEPGGAAASPASNPPSLSSKPPDAAPTQQEDPPVSYTHAALLALLAFWAGVKHKAIRPLLGKAWSALGKLLASLKGKRKGAK